MQTLFVDFAHPSAYLAVSTNVYFGKLHSAYKLTEENEEILLVRCTPWHSTAKKRCDLLACDIETFRMKALGHFSFSAKPAEALNEIFYFIEMKGVSFLRHMPARWQSLMLRKDVKMLTWRKTQIFEAWDKQKVRISFGNTLRMNISKEVIKSHVKEKLIVLLPDFSYYVSVARKKLTFFGERLP